ncbi:hypothetical protein [Lysobacter niastensis]|nr:hypothetical protein [Lysobacter niastensis]
MDALNRECFCIAIEPGVMRNVVAAAIGEHGLPSALAESHAHLFSALPVYLRRRHLRQVEHVISAIEQVVALPGYQRAALQWAPDIAQFDPGSPGGLLGFDFHLTNDGPRLIEINTNPGGILLNALLGQAQRVCMPDVVQSPTNVATAEERVLQVMLEEWRCQRGSAPLNLVAIVDEEPEQQYLYPEFLLFRQLFRAHGIDAVICDSQDLVREPGRVSLGGRPVDMIYNRLTDFSLSEPRHGVVRAAYLAGDLVLTPHPRAHAIYADKRNFTLLGDRAFLAQAGAGDAEIDVLSGAIPETVVVTPSNRDTLWERRRELFFKPAAGFGGKASYRGDKLTRRIWNDLATGTCIAQRVIPPSIRHVGINEPLKSDIRCYAYRGQPILYAARLYQGQTTNFRTPGGGFAPVLTSSAPDS